VNLDDMRPVLAADYVLDGWRGHSEVRGDFAVFQTVSPHLAYATNVISRQTGSTVPLPCANAGTTGWVASTRHGSPATLRPHVADVVGLRSKEEMRRPDTQGDVAAVENFRTIGDRAVGQDPRDAVRRTDSEAVPDVAVTAAGSTGADPQPASVALLYLRPEPPEQWTASASGLSLVDASRHGGLL